MLIQTDGTIARTIELLMFGDWILFLQALLMLISNIVILARGAGYGFFKLVLQ